MMRKFWLLVALAALGIATVPGLEAPPAHAAAKTFSVEQTIAVPPASSYQGAGGGDGWAVALTSSKVYNVFHHSGSLEVACHLQTTAASCGPTKVITDGGDGFSTANHVGLWLDDSTERLYVYATRNADQTAGVVCVDTTSPDPNPFCGFTALGSPGGSQGMTLGSAVLLGQRWYSFNYFPGKGVEGSSNKLLCFDTAAVAACSGQPFEVDLGPLPSVGGGSVSGIPANIAGRLVIPVALSGGNSILACYDPASGLGRCTGSWPVVAPTGYVGANGAPFPLLTAAGRIDGVCLPTSNAPCFTLSGDAVASPPGLAAATGSSSPYNGEAITLGARVYVPNGNVDQVKCYNYLTSAECAGFPKAFANLGYLYTVNVDPQRPTCIWVNADYGSGQIQNFDAYTGGACGEGPIRVLASKMVVDSPACVPTRYDSLAVLDPARSSYNSGSIDFADGDAQPIPGVGALALDSSGKADLSTVDLDTSTGLPQFLITLEGVTGTPGAVTVRLTWTGEALASCDPDDDVEPIKMVSLGDSYSSGEGTFDYDAHKAAQKCHRGPKAWARIIESKTLEVTEIEHKACTGAKTGDLIQTYKDNPPQIPTTPDPSVDLVVMTLGGNDVGFAGILRDCVLPGGTCADDADSKGFENKLSNLYASLTEVIYPKVRAAYPSARIVHVGYPKLMVRVGTEPVGCGWLGDDEQKAAPKLANKLNGTIYWATEADPVVEWVDVSDILAGRELCTSDSWMEPLYCCKSESGHPREPGQKAYALKVAAALALTWLELPEY